MIAKCFVILIGITIASCKHQHFYRKDYTFVEEFDAFYKIHWDTHGISWDAAFLACDDEGAELYYPKQENEWKVVKNLSSYLPEAPNVTEIFIGIHDEFGLGEFMTVDGQPSPLALIQGSVLNDGQHCIVMDMVTGLFRRDHCFDEYDNTVKPFVCKKEDYHPPCPTVDKGYVYAKEMKKCYKVNKRAKIWQDAMHTCFMEGGVLVVIENEHEANFVHELLRNEPDNKFFAGFRKWFAENEFYTVKGRKLSESGYTRWYNREKENDFNCGGLYTTNPLSTTPASCETRLPFVCEMTAIV